MSSAASHSGAAAAASSSSSAAPATRYYFCHRCFLATMLAADAACPLCGGAFVEEIDVPPFQPPNPNPNPNHIPFLTTGSLFASPASFVLRCRADADAFFRSEISPLRHLMCCPARCPPLPLAFLEASIDDFLASGTRVYVVLAGVLPPADRADSDHDSHDDDDDDADYDIDSEAHQIALDARENQDIFISPAARWAVAALRDIQTVGGRHGDALCAVCQEALAVGAVAKQFPCKHVFHKECIVEWLRRQHTCPVCRFPLLTEEVGGPSHAVVFRVVVPPLSLGLNLDKNIVAVYHEERGKPQIPPRRWA